MRMWSQGLGKIELEVDGRTMDVIKQDKEIKITGITDAPVEWVFEVTLEKDDFIGLLNVILTRKMLSFFRANIKLVFSSLFDRSEKEKPMTRIKL
ncbi:MAG: hypothetical protein GY857_15240 [Desulfobacula sp.]|nr:hypothetical protein [Desulfobacula sp.]